ncbi:MAG TPA: DUF423 domain-containing protein [Chitinophagaceae bacterium]|nr:DUF423 domain-containing protein [Chitinophagaceae bacterium]
MHKTYLSIAALLGAIAVALGAFGAHGLKKIVPEETVATFQTGVQYQMYHTFALLAAGILFEKFSGKWIKWAGICFITGIVLFSGSLYTLTILKATEQTGLRGIGIITPFGGVLFIAGWLFLFLGIMKKAD